MSNLEKLPGSILKQSDWFRNLSDDILAEIVSETAHYHLKPDQSLIEKGDQGKSMFLILEGWVKVVIPDEDEGEIILNHLGPGEIVGEMSLIDNRPRSASVVALSDITALEFSQAKFFKLLENHPAIGIHMISAMSNRMRFVLKYVENAIHWSQKIGDGDYSFLDQIEIKDGEVIIDNSRSDDVRANNFLYAFHEMAKEVQTREKDLKEELKKLYIQIDQTKRDQELFQITSSNFFEKLKEDSENIKRARDKKA